MHNPRVWGRGVRPLSDAFEMFEELMSTIKEDIVSSVFRSSTSVESFESFLTSLPRTLVHDEVSMLVQLPVEGAPAGVPPSAMAGVAGGPAPAPSDGGGVRREAPKVGRNDPCPCGSGKKYKKCCGR